ncbi:hypothetical protein GCM10009430_32120 [Aquimarina litoralis]|uniref:Uncharacterized protein n=1 Tax=Aquimarina litoralis TaxID=584605 RepID=A0ABN1J1K6_9FLAO
MIEEKTVKGTHNQNLVPLSFVFEAKQASNAIVYLVGDFILMDGFINDYFLSKLA